MTSHDSNLESDLKEAAPMVRFSRRDFLVSAATTSLALAAGPVMAHQAIPWMNKRITSSARLDYTGPREIKDLVIGVPIQLQGFTADGGPITWSVVANDYATLSPDGLLTPIAATPRDLNGAPIPVVVQITLDDGKP